MAIVVFSRGSAYGQCMVYSSTVYTDYSVSTDGTVYAWGSTCAPSTCAVIHSYTTTTKITMPDGSVTQQTVGSSGFDPANTFIMANMNSATLGLGNPLAGDNIDITSFHSAYCPCAGYIFLSTATAVTLLGTKYQTAYRYDRYDASRGYIYKPTCTSPSGCTKSEIVGPSYLGPYAECPGKYYDIPIYGRYCSDTCSGRTTPGTCL
jgi:hypothetical protein